MWGIELWKTGQRWFSFAFTRVSVLSKWTMTLILQEWGLNTISKNIPTTVFQLRTFINGIDCLQNEEIWGIQGELKTLLIWGPHHIITLQGVYKDHHLEIIEKERLPGCKIYLLRIVLLEVGVQFTENSHHHQLMKKHHPFHTNLPQSVTTLETGHHHLVTEGETGPHHQVTEQETLT